MADLILKKHGADGIGVLAEEPDGRWRASLTVRAQDQETEQLRGPEFFGSERMASDWVIRQAAHHGFAFDDFDIIVEPHNA